MSESITLHCRCAYPSLSQPKMFQGETEAKYRLTLVLPENDPQLANIRAIEQHLIQSELDGVIPIGNNVLLKKDPNNAAMAGHVYISAKNKQQPGLVDTKRQKLLDASLIQDGDWVWVSIGIFGYTQPSKGIGAFLNHVMFERHGDGKLGKGGGPSIDEAFKDVPMAGGAAQQSPPNPF